MLKIGLTGGIGCGKSTVTAEFARLKVPIIDADVIAHQLVTIGKPALQQIVELFGKQILNSDQSLNRAYLGRLIFNDSNKKNQLEALMHPLIYQQIHTELSLLQHQYCIICIPLLVETAKLDLVDRVLVIECSEQQQIMRVKQRNGLSTTQIKRIISTQASTTQRRLVAHDILNNSTSIQELLVQIKSLHSLYLSLNSGTYYL